MRVAIRMFIVASGLFLPALLAAAPPPAAGASPDVLLSMQGNPATGDPNDLITYTIRIDNLGPQDAPSLWVNDTLPTGTAYGDDTAATDIPAPVFLGRSFSGNTVRLQFANYTDNAGTRVGGSQAFADVTVEVPAADPPWALIAAGIVAGVIAAIVALRLYFFAIERSVIDEVFLLHKDGLLVKHYARRLRPDVDSDILSGKLIAVQNFVNESFIGEAGLRKEGQLDEMKFGQYRILLVRGKYVIVAAVVSGPRVEKVAGQIRAAIEDLEVALGGVLETWDGNMDQVSPADAYMQDLIAGRYRNPAKVRRGNH